ncbi:MAG TPA: hypothetical protein VF306_00910 [Pirellulales bacterium]
MVDDLSVSGNGVLAIDASQNAPLIVGSSSPLVASGAADPASLSNASGATTDEQTANDLAVVAVAAELDASGPPAGTAAGGQLTSGVSSVNNQKRPLLGE